MSLFSSKPNSYLGIDIGGQSIKVVEIQKERGKAMLRTFGIADRPFSPKRLESEEDPVKLGQLIKDLCAKAKVSSDRVITALPTFDVFSSIINLPLMSEKDLPGAVSREAKKLIPLPLEEMSFHWKKLDVEVGATVGVVDSDDNGTNIKIAKKKQDFIKVLLTAAPASLVLRYVTIFKHAGLNLLNLEPEIFAMIRSLVGRDPALAMLVDLGAVNTTISLVEQGVPILNRGVDSGGKNVSRVIERVLGIESGQAEQFKKDFSEFVALYHKESSQLPKDVELSVAPIVNEIKYIFSLVANQAGEITLSGNASSRIERIVLTGGSATLAYLAPYLEKLFDTKVYVGDPWARVLYPEDLRFLLEEIGPQLSISIGLGMREITS
ncbi:MAG: Uncharacterized protein G01um101418_618 [Parcubacteria group bacterium Gr01-1014_18]|nr:MAG: Uncharacterized protein Greene041636_91 [Parcubacteria group bacterium Greene0416_36]TSC80870.1 MAG: Uncharacterized protein G01um101418_618 [Parcubacteria group bacterium Gr01-1014_18]TSC99531.1 MAG: Uncharacterized protein Greene101420_198 [Parcubacteria group bacterium Greene1014_20]TSD07550.1 MAG: Uncharacterized protein Greene07142_7 [Parcubacteria group bacterium Greene0714_2]